MNMAERLQVQSCSPFEIYHILNSLEKASKITVEAELFLPKVKDRLAALLPFMEVWGGHSTIKTISISGLKLDLRYVK